MKDPSERRAPDDGAEVVEEEGAPVGDGAEALLELVLSAPAAGEEAVPARPARVDGVVIGRLVAVGEGGEAVVAHRYAAAPAGDPARAMLALSPEDVGREVALLFEGGDPDRPIVAGLMHAGGPAAAPRAEADGERLVFEADKEIVLRCGEASITLTRAGKVLIRGAYVLTRSSGVHRIQGGSVEIN